MYKIKLNITKKIFYLNISFLSLIVLVLTIYFLDSIIIGTKAFDYIQDQKVYDEALTKYIRGKVISYIMNCFIIGVYTIYMILLQKRISYGYVFVMLWFILFIAITASPHILDGSHDDNIKLLCGIIISILSGIICLVLLYMANQIRLQRLINNNKFISKLNKKQKGI